MKRSKPNRLQGFNPRGELIKTINADASVDETVFDALGRKIKVIHPGGNSAVMAYDLASRLLSRNYFAAGSGIAESTDSFTYDLASRPVTANNADALISYTYDSIGRRSSLTQTVDGLAKTVSFAYDAANRLLSRSPEGLAVESRTFTNRSQLASVSLSTGLVGILPALVASFDYDAIGRETSRTYGNGLNTTSGYTRADNLITSITVANKPELSFGYSYDSNKNVTAEQRGGSMALYSWNATFDAMDRLNSQNDGAQTRSWNLDLVGNTTSETVDGNAEARSLNDMHAPTAAGNKAYSYDSNGQMTTKPGYTLVWDARNHLVSSSSIGSPGVPPAAAVSYRYDAFGNRVSKGSTRYLLVDNQVVAEFTGGASKQYCYGSYIDEVLAEKGADVSYYHRNRQYNTSALTDSSGAVLEMYSTDAMGRVKSFDAAGSTTSPSSLATNVLFTGRVFDTETGLYYFRARYFEPELGGFISRDPLGFVDGKSVYQSYFSNTFKLDPSGCSRVEIWRQHTWTNINMEIVRWVQEHLGFDPGNTWAYGHYLLVWGESSDGCTFSASGKDSSEGKFTFSQVPMSYRFQIAGPTAGSKIVPKCKCKDEKVDCITYTSEYVSYFGIKNSYIDFSITVASSTISLTICADGSTTVNVDSYNPDARVFGS